MFDQQTVINEPAKLVEQGRIARGRRRLIFNNDGDDISYRGSDTVGGCLAQRTTPPADTQVDSVFYNTGLKPATRP